MGTLSVAEHRCVHFSLERFEDMPGRIFPGSIFSEGASAAGADGLILMLEPGCSPAIPYPAGRSDHHGEEQAFGADKRDSLPPTDEGQRTMRILEPTERIVWRFSIWSDSTARTGTEVAPSFCWRECSPRISTPPLKRIHQSPGKADLSSTK